MNIYTALARLLIRRAGATPETIIGPGRLIARLSAQQAVSVSVRPVNPYARAVAAYRQAGKPVPPHVSAGLEQ